MSELKPCPFCGGKAVLYVDEGVHVECIKCEASSKTRRDLPVYTGLVGSAVESVIEAWNRRIENERVH